MAIPFDRDLAILDSGTHLGLVDAVPVAILARSVPIVEPGGDHFLRWLHRDAKYSHAKAATAPQSANFVASGLTAKGSGDRSRII